MKFRVLEVALQLSGAAHAREQESGPFVSKSLSSAVVRIVVKEAA
jgi:hypothetical protein